MRWKPDPTFWSIPARSLDHDIEVIGEVRAELFVQSSLEHTDFFVRLCDVDPKGKSINVSDGLRASATWPANGGRRRRLESRLRALAHRALLQERPPHSGSGSRGLASPLRPQHRQRRAAGNRNHAGRRRPYGIPRPGPPVGYHSARKKLMRKCRVSQLLPVIPHL